MGGMALALIGAAAAGSGGLVLVGEDAGGAFGAALAAADVGGDGAPDLLVAAPGAERVWVFTNAAGAFDASAGVALDAPEPGGFGGALAAADLDGDGSAEILVGAAAAREGAGCVWLFVGQIPTDPICGDLKGGPVGVGAAVAAAGDLNGDGYGDAALGSANPDDPGAVWLLYGSAKGGALGGALGYGRDSGDSAFGSAVAGAGDVDGDGFDDLLVGAPGRGAGGQALIFYGDARGPVDGGYAALDGSKDYTYYALDLVGADLDADGYSDAVVGELYGAEGAGGAWVHAGSIDGPSEIGLALANDGEATNFSAALAAAGDVDGDGYPDLLIGARNLGYAPGAAYVFYGGAGGLDAGLYRAIAGPADQPWYGDAAAGAGDVDGDGHSDLLIGARGGADDPGWAHLIYGGPDRDLVDAPKDTGDTGLIDTGPVDTGEDEDDTGRVDAPDDTGELVEDTGDEGTRRPGTDSCGLGCAAGGGGGGWVVGLLVVFRRRAAGSLSPPAAGSLSPPAAGSLSPPAAP